MAQYPIISSIGLEIETENIIRGNLPRNLREWFSEEHDASIETPIQFDPDNHALLLEDPDNILDFPQGTMGSEFVSRVLNTEDDKTRPVIDRLLGWIYNQGESEESFRSGIHVHVCMPYNMKILKNLTYLAAHLEQVFYYYGGMGYEFRGIRNDFTYCRPFTQCGPSVIPWNGGYAQVFTKEKLLRAKTELEFFDQYGAININHPQGKYTPVRYGWFTFYPLVTKGTVEFRVFNKTLNPNKIWSAIRFCQKFCEVAMSPSLLSDLPENSIYDSHSKDHVLDTFTRFAGLGDLDSASVKSGIQTIEKTPEMQVEPAYVISHLSPERFALQYQFGNPENISPRATVKKPNFVDVHQLARNNRRV